MTSPRLSIITAVRNRASTIASTIDSVLRQKDASIEYIIVDGNSTDGTSEIAQGYGERIDTYVRESDQGIYDALNKGIGLARGDVVGFLHADDLLADDLVAHRIATAFQDRSVDAVYGDLLYVDAEDIHRISRYWRSGAYQPERFRWGWMPPHPTVYLRRDRYLELGGYRLDFQISADYELLVRMLYKHRLNTRYLQSILVKMRLGGKSNASLGNRLLANREDRQAWEVNGLKPPVCLRFLKPMRKLRQFWERPRVAT